MSSPSPILAILASEQDSELANQLAVALGYQNANVVIGTPASGAIFLSQNALLIKYVIIDIGQRGLDVISEIDQLAEQCPEDVRVVVMGATNDIKFYREMINRGVLEYFVHPVTVGQLREALASSGEDAVAKASNSKVITFMSAASGDGSSTMALNTAFCLSRFYSKSTVLVDMDFQFGMIARNLDLHSPFGTKELLEHSERVVDETLINRMLVDYNGTFKVMAAPSDLRLWPDFI
jgi:pilus assembly protein CpaE